MKGLSLCMIVRDEERQIRRCLDSVRDVVDEIVVVDTGSKDRTPDICSSYGAVVCPFEWNDSFAEARNYGLARARGEWILYLDADEEVDAADRFKLKEVVREREAQLAAVRLLNYTGESPDPHRAYLVEQYRLFRNGLGLRFRHDIHEMLDVGKLHAPAAASLPVTVRHYGYLDDRTDDKRKFDRNIRLLEKELAKPEHDPWMEYHAASEYYRIGQYETALRYVNHAILRFLQRGIVPPSLLYKLKYDMLLSPVHAKQALSTIEFAIRLHADYVDLQYDKGVLLFYEGRYREAIETFRRCLDIGEANLRHLTLKGAGSFRAWHYMGKCWARIGQPRKAEACYRKALAAAPTYREAADDLRQLTDLR